MKKVLIISTNPRIGSNFELFSNEFMKNAIDNVNIVEISLCIIRRIKKH